MDGRIKEVRILIEYESPSQYYIDIEKPCCLPDQILEGLLTKLLNNFRKAVQVKEEGKKEDRCRGKITPGKFEFYFGNSSDIGQD
jgi:hypothetical protein